MKKVYTLAACIVVLFLMAASASAASDSKTSGSGASGSATWQFTNDDVQSMDTYIDVYENIDGSTEIYLSCYYNDVNGVYHSFWGSMTTTDDVFTVNKKLASASLSEVSIDGQYYDDETGYYSGTATIAADWAGVGDITQVKYTVKDGTFYSVKGTTRDATATGSIVFEGTDIIGEESTDNANIEQYTSTTMIKKISLA